MTSQIADEVRYQDRPYAITAVAGSGLFDPAEYGIATVPLSSACWRGFLCHYRIRDNELVLDALVIGRRDDRPMTLDLFGVRARIAGDEARYPGALVFRGLAEPVPFTGRLLLGADPVDIGYLNMGFWPAWGYARVHELALDAGRLGSAHDRSADVAEVRRISAEGAMPAATGPAPDEPVGEWIKRTFSRTFDYSWPDVD